MHVVKRGGVWTGIDPDTRRAEILVRLPSAFLSVRLSVYGLEACKQMLLSPPLPKGRGRGTQIHAPRPGRVRVLCRVVYESLPT